MLSPFHDLANNDVALKITLLTDPEVLSNLYLHSRDFKAYLTCCIVLVNLSKQHLIYGEPQTFPEFYTQYIIKYHPKKTCISYQILRSISIYNDDLDGLLTGRVNINGLVTLTNPEIVWLMTRGKSKILNKFYEERSNVDMIFSENQFDAIVSENQLNTIIKVLDKHSHGLWDKDMIMFYMNYFFRQLLINNLDRSVLLKSIGEEIGKCIAYLPENIIMDIVDIFQYLSDETYLTFLTTASSLDLADVLKMLKIKNDKEKNAILSGCKLTSTAIIAWLKTEANSLKYCTYEGSALETLKLSNELFDVDAEVFFCTVCINSDTPSIVWLLRRGNIPYKKVLKTMFLKISHIVFVLLYNYLKSGQVSLRNSEQWEDRKNRERYLSEECFVN